LQECRPATANPIRVRRAFRRVLKARRTHGMSYLIECGLYHAIAIGGSHADPPPHRPPSKPATTIQRQTQRFVQRQENRRH